MVSKILLNHFLKEARSITKQLFGAMQSYKTAEEHTKFMSSFNTL